LKRFPRLRFGMLEGGVGWACNLFTTDLIAHWEKRSRGPMEKHLRPTNLDKNLLKDLFTRFGGRPFEEQASRERVGSRPARRDASVSCRRPTWRGHARP
jgi:hypothetical protein